MQIYFLYIEFKIQQNNNRRTYHTEPAKAYYIHIELPFSKHVQNCIRVNIFFHVYIIVVGVVDDVDVVVQMYNFHWVNECINLSIHLALQLMTGERKVCKEMNEWNAKKILTLF